MLDPNDIAQIQQMIQDRESYAQYNVTPIPNHVHNGTDSPRVSYNDLANIPTSSTGFGGDGSDGALNIASGTTTIDLAGAKFVEKNYTNIAITGSGALAFSNPHDGGTTITFRSQGDVTITSSATRAIDLRSLGSASSNGAAGVNNTNGAAATNATSPNCIFSYLVDAIVAANGGAGSTGSNQSNATAGSFTITLFNKTAFNVARFFNTMALISAPAGGGGGGGSGKAVGTSGNGGNGGRGSGSLYLECGGALNFTGTIDASGTAGDNGNAGGGTNNGGSGGGGGGAGGIVVILYNELTLNSGTITLTGGAGGNGSNGGGTLNSGNNGGGQGGAGGANLLYAGGSGGKAGYDAAHAGTSGGTGGNSGGAGGTAGSGNVGTFGVSTTSGGGGGGGGGAKGFSLVSPVLLD